MRDYKASDPTPASVERTKKVWVALAEMFGNAFLNAFGTNAPSVWIAAIEQLTDDEVRRGLVNISEDNMRFAPNLSQFIDACKRLPPVRHLGVPQIEDQRPPGRMPYAEWKKKNGVEG